MVSAKNSKIFSRLFFSKIVLEVMLSHCLERKESFYDDKNVNFVKSKKRVFSKGFNSWFRPKNSKLFSRLFFSKIVLEIMLSYGLERKEGFYDDKNVNFVKSKTWLFSKGVNPLFRSKNRKFF